MEELDTKLTVSLDGNDVTIDVIDIVESAEYNKEYIFYTIDGVANQEVFASILNEAEESFTLETITDDEEFDYVNQLMAKLTLDFAEEGLIEELNEQPEVKEETLDATPSKVVEDEYNITDSKEEVEAESSTPSEVLEDSYNITNSTDEMVVDNQPNTVAEPTNNEGNNETIGE